MDRFHGTGNAIETRSILINGSPASWTALLGTWTNNNVQLAPGLNRVLVQALDSNAKEIRELKSENAKLKEKRADIQWVAKSEFDELKKAFAAKDQELARLKQSHG